MGWEFITGPNFVLSNAQALPSGATLQIKYAENTSVVAQTTSMAGASNTIPVNTDGTQILSVTLTPSATANNLLVTGLACLSGSTEPANIWMALFQDANQTALAATEFGSGNQNVVTPGVLSYQFAAGTTGPTTLTIRCGNFATNNATWALNARSNPVARRLGGASRATVIVQETKV